MSRLVILSGVPGSGKSTYATEHNWNEPVIVLSTDNIRKKLTGDASCLDKDDMVWGYIYTVLASPCMDAVYVVDATNLVARRRKTYLAFKDTFDTIELIYLYVDLETALKRNAERDRHVPEKVIHDMMEMAAKNMNFADLLEAGYDKISIIKNM